MDDCVGLQQTLVIAQAVLMDLEKKAAGYTSLTTPSHLTIDLNAKRQEVESLQERLKRAQLAKKESKQVAQAGINQPSRMRSRVPTDHYIERDQAKRLLERFAVALKPTQGQPLLFNIYGIGGVGKTTLLGRLQEAHAGEVDFLDVCFAKTADIEMPLKLMRRLHQQAMGLGGLEAADAFTQREQQFGAALFELSHKSVDGETISSEESRKITSWFEQLIWLGSTSLISTPSKPKSFEVAGGFSISAAGEDAEGLKDWIQQRVRNHPATKNEPELQALMLEPVSRLTQAFAESLMQIAQSRGRSLVLVLDTYEKAQPYLNQWLWQYLVEDTPLESAPVKLVVVGRRSLQTDEGWRKLNQDRKLLYETPLTKFSKQDTEVYLQKIGIEKGRTRANIFKATQGLPYYLDWVRKQREQGEDPDFSKGNQAIAELLLQGRSSQERKILQVVACCRWFDLAIIRHLLNSDGLGLQNAGDDAESYFEWLKGSDFVEFAKGYYRLDDVARDVFRQSYFQDDQTQFRKTNSLLADYFKGQADEVVDPQSPLPDPYKDEEWRGLIAEFLYYSLFGKGREGLQRYVEQVFAAVYLREPDIFMTPFAFVSAEMSEENQNLLPKSTGAFFKDSGIALGLGWFFLDKLPGSYEHKFESDGNLSTEVIEKHLKKLEDSLRILLEQVDSLPDGLSKSVGLMYQSLRCHRSRDRSNLLLQAKTQTEQLMIHCRPKLIHGLFSNLGRLLIGAERYQDSLDCYEKAFELAQGNAVSFFGQGFALKNLERYKEAIESYQKAIELDPKLVQAWSSKGATLNNLERYEEAIESCQKAIELDPKSVQAWGNKGVALGNLERYEEAIESYQKAIELDPKSVNAWVNKGVALKNLERYKEAIESYQKAIELDPKSVNAWVNKGVALGNLERYEEAIESYQKAIELDPKSVNAWVNKGVALGNLERHEEAIESYQKAIELDPKDVNAWANKGAALSNLERYEEAIESCQKAIELDPKSVNAWANKGAALDSLERYEEAIESCQKAIELDPNDVDAWKNKGDVLRNVKRYEEALAAFNQALEIVPQNANALNSKALTLSFVKDFEKALSAIDEAISLEPEEAVFKANRGIILARAERYTEALADCEQTIQQDPKDESSYYAKACCHALQNEIEQAIDYLQKAIDIAPRRSRSEAKRNPDFDGIRTHERFRALVY
ncbi:MAG: tetratricopeptide repeat protein [Drouetiella hepatica Uher 2000/2452]|uniref:Tetratricopeptide repeat protein n=1 Tax=Drouetiella hepatica Uher 2000/2452 TaxID=904376 RepID=A0A951QAL9_9CYAN|nr:tetratricopeptide repeat protein [Drouetiella hepatica Uher 2000/2452]